MFALFPFRLYAPQIPKIATIRVAMLDRRANAEIRERGAEIAMRRRAALVDMTETETLP